MKTSWLNWLEWGARFFVWVFGMILAILTVIGAINILPPNTALGLVIAFYVFIFALLVVWVGDVYRMYPPRRRKQQPENRQQDQQ